MHTDAINRRGRMNSAESRSDSDLPPVPSVHPVAQPTRESTMLSNGAALYRDSEIPWEIEAAAREAMEDALA